MSGAAVPTPGVWGLNLVRAGLGGGLLIAPNRRLHELFAAPSDREARLLASVLGARYLLQAALTGSHPDRRRLELGAAVDAAHAASMVLLAGYRPRWRRAALINVAMAFALATAGRHVGRATPPAPP